MKPGYRTTEAWATALLVVGLVLAAVASNLSGQVAAYCATASMIAYTISRGLAKINPPKDG